MISTDVWQSVSDLVHEQKGSHMFALVRCANVTSLSQKQTREEKMTVDTSKKNDSDNDAKGGLRLRSLSQSLSSSLHKHDESSSSGRRSVIVGGINVPNAWKDSPLTVFARHKIHPGKEQDFEDWLQEITRLQLDYPGFLGLEVIRPASCCEPNEHVSIFRYDTYEHLQHWMDSDDRTRMLEKSKDFEEEPIQISYHSLEYWFVSEDDNNNYRNGKKDSSTAVAPPKWKMVIVTFLVIWLQSRYVASQYNRIPNIPAWFALGIGVLTVVILTTYIVMPIVTKYILFWFLFPSKIQLPWNRQGQRQEEREAGGKDGDVDDDDGTSLDLPLHSTVTRGGRSSTSSSSNSSTSAHATSNQESNEPRTPDETPAKITLDGVSTAELGHQEP